MPDSSAHVDVAGAGKRLLPARVRLLFSAGAAGFDFNLRLELELFKLLVFACLLERVFELELLLCSSPSRAMELETARQTMVENTSANLMILISSKNREPMMCRL